MATVSVAITVVPTATVAVDLEAPSSDIPMNSLI